MIQTIEFDPFLKNFFEFANKYLDESHFHCLMERVQGRTLAETAKACPRYVRHDGKSLMPYKAINVFTTGEHNIFGRPYYYCEFEKIKFSNKKQFGISKELARQKEARACRKWRKFLTVKYGSNWQKDFSK